MGQRSTFMNTFALQDMVFMTKRMLLDLWQLYLQTYPDRKEFGITRAELQELTKGLDLHDSDIDFLDKVFLCTDAAGFGSAPMKTVLVSFAMLLPIKVEDTVDVAMKIHCNDYESELISKTQVLTLLKIINTTLTHFGDKPLHVSQIDDLVDSVYTLRGKVDGDIGRDDFITLMIQHPIVELALSVQFQGNIQWKTQQNNS